jgi:hypothetical protein
MTFNLYALSIALIAIAVICIYCAAYVVVSADVMVWRCDRRAQAQWLTYWLTLEISIIGFAIWYFA